MGGIRSQMIWEAWCHELSFENDGPLHDYLFYGIKDGFIIVDTESVVPSYDCPNYIPPDSGAAFDFVNNLIHTELDQGKYIIADAKPHCIHSIGAVPKSDGKFRPITDCKRPLGLSINNFMNSTCETFSYNSVDSVCDMMYEGCFMATVDIASAYRSITINPSQWSLQGIRWFIDGSETLLLDTRICFGGKNSPYLFTQVSNFISRCMARRGLPDVINYLDDFIVVADTFDSCQRAQLTLINLLITLGFEIAWKKCTSPSTTCVYLGILFDSSSMEISLPQHKLDKLHHELQFFSGKTRATKRQIQRLCGVLAHCAKVVRGGRTFSRRIIDMLSNLPEGNPRLHLSNDFLLDIKWWADFASHFNGVACIIENNFLNGPTLYSDASQTGYGVVMDGYWKAGFFNSTQVPFRVENLIPDHFHWLNFDVDTTNINVLELVPILLAVRQCGATWCNQHVICYTDNTQVVSCLNRGTSINLLSMEMLREICWSSAINNFHITARHIRGCDNYLPDLLSRLSVSNDLTSVFSFPLCCSGSPGVGS